VPATTDGTRGPATGPRGTRLNMASWLSLRGAVLLMYLGVVPSIVNIYLLWDDRQKPSVAWFILSMATGGAWAFLFATFTAVVDPGLTRALANLFWVMIPTAAVAMFLLAYEFVFKQTVSRRVVLALCLPVVVLFGLTWVNPENLIFTAEYRVGPNGVLYFPSVGGPVKFVVTKLYGYLLVFLAAGMFVGEVLRTEGIHRRQAVYLLVVFSILVLSTMVKVAGLVPIYFDPTSVVYSLSGVFFAYSINKHGLMRFVPTAREQTFTEVSDAILIANPDGRVVDANVAARRLFDGRIVGTRLEAVMSGYDEVSDHAGRPTITVDQNGTRRFFSRRTSPTPYGRGLEGRIVLLTDVTELKKRENELELLKQVLFRVFRHNIRNDLNVIAGYAELIRKTSEGETAEWAAGLESKADKVVNQAEKVQHIEEVFSYDRTVPWPVRTEIEQVLDDHRDRPEVTITADIEDVDVDVHPRFDLAIQELVDNAITHHVGDEPVAIRVYTERADDQVTIVVEDNGPGLPTDEIEVLRSERETDLEHGSGAGLWLIHWIVSRSGGDFSVDILDDGTRVSVRLPVADSERGDPEPTAG